MSALAQNPVVTAIAAMLYIIAPFVPPVLGILIGWPDKDNRWWRHLLFAPAAIGAELLVVAPWLSLNWSDAAQVNSGFGWGLILPCLSAITTIVLYYAILSVRIIIRSLRRWLVS